MSTFQRLAWFAIGFIATLVIAVVALLAAIMGAG